MARPRALSSRQRPHCDGAIRLLVRRAAGRDALGRISRGRDAGPTSRRSVSTTTALLVVLMSACSAESDSPLRRLSSIQGVRHAGCGDDFDMRTRTAWGPVGIALLLLLWLVGGSCQRSWWLIDGVTRRRRPYSGPPPDTRRTRRGLKVRNEPDWIYCVACAYRAKGGRRKQGWGGAAWRPPATLRGLPLSVQEVLMDSRMRQHMSDLETKGVCAHCPERLGRFPCRDCGNWYCSTACHELDDCPATDLI